MEEMSMVHQTFRAFHATPPCIPFHYRYDDVGSRLFDEYVQTEPYYLYHADEFVVRENSDEIMKAAAGGTSTGKVINLIDLGSGMSRKIPCIIKSFLAGGCQAPLNYFPVDISREALDATMTIISEEFSDSVNVRPINDTFSFGLAKVASFLHHDHVNLIIFLGGTISNIEAEEQSTFLRSIFSVIKAPCKFLCTFDLTQNVPLLMAAYRDHPLSKLYLMNGLWRLGRDLLTRPLNIDHFVLDVEFHRTNGQNFLTQRARLLRDTTFEFTDECLAEVGPERFGKTLTLSAGDVIHLYDGTQSNSKWTAGQLDALLSRTGLAIGNRWNVTDGRGMDVMVAMVTGDGARQL